MTRIVSAFLVCFVLSAMVACGGGSSTPPPTPTPTPAASITVTPNSTTVALGGSQSFTSNGTNVTWSLSGPGSIDSQSGVYLAPTAFPGVGSNTATITATASNGKGTASAVVVYPNDHQSFQSGPIKLGTSGGNVNDVDTGPKGGCCIGTLGSLWTRGGNFFILSNNHVLARSGATGTQGEAINQPGPTLCFGINKTVANETEAADLKPTTTDPVGCKGDTAPTCGPSPTNTDAAIAAVAPGEVDPTGAILDFGTAGATSIGDAPPSATIFAGTITPGQPVAKSGRTSALTCSTIQAIDGSFFVDYDASCGGAKAFGATFNNQIVINGGNFIQAGDSGSLLVTADTAEPMGLLFAASPTSALANRIADVQKDFNATGAFTIVGGPDRSISCAPTQSVQGTKVGIGAASTVTPQQQQAAISARDRHARPLLADPAIRSVTAGASADSPGDGAVVIEVKGTPKNPIPPTLDGVRTKVVYAQAPAALTKAELESAIAIKQAHRDGVLSSPGIEGIAVGRSDDNPAEPAILIYTIKGAAHPPIAQVIDGVRTKIIESGPFVAK